MTKESGSSVLPKKKVRLVPIIRTNTLIKESAAGGDITKHKGYFRWRDTAQVFKLPKSIKTGNLAIVLTEKEEKFISEKIHRDLSIYNDKNNFWETFKVEIMCDDELLERGKLFNLADPYEFLSYKVLVKTGFFAPTWESRFDRGEYEYAFVEEGYKEEEIAQEADEALEIGKYISEISDSHEKMFNFLSVVWLESATAKRPQEDNTEKFLRTEIYQFSQTNKSKFLELIRDKDGILEFKYFVHQATLAGAMKRDINKKSYELPNGVPIGKNLKEVISWLRDDKNNEEYLKMDAQIKMKK